MTTIESTPASDPTRDERTRRPRVRRPKRRVEGMTLVEIMIVVIIMAMIATAVGVAVLPQLEKARIRSTRADAQQIRAAVTMYLSGNPGASCPSVEELVQDGDLDSSKRTADAWEHDFQIECDGPNISVVSAGPDGQFGSEDDVQ